MFRIIKLLSVCLALMAISCATSKVILNTQYQQLVYNDPSLVIVLKEEPRVNYSGNVQPEFGPGDPLMLIRDFFKKQLIEDIKSQTILKTIEFGKCTPNGYIEKQQIGSGEVSEIEVLMNGGKYDCQNPDPAYVLVLSEIYIGTSLESHFNAPMMGSNGMMIGGGSSTKKKLTYQAKAYLYDNRAKQFVEYGIIDEYASGFFPVITINEWKNASETFVRKLFNKTKLIK